MIAAIYARKSTEQSNIAEEGKSVARQIAHARAYAERKGWTVAEEHLYADDGISGAEFLKRPGLARLMNAFTPSPPFQVLIMSEDSRLGREQIETAYLLKQIVTAGVRVFFYLEDRERTLDSPLDKMTLSLTAFADELEREKARQRTTDALLRKARAGHVTGGRVFGYDNVPITATDSEGRTTRHHVARQVNESEAAIVRRIFELCGAGLGFTSIAKRLNDEGAPAPRPRAGRPRAWAPSSVREMLFRDLYRGMILWNRTQKRNAWGVKRQRPRPENEWLHVPAPELRIVSDDLWCAAHERLSATRGAYLSGTSGQRWGRPASGIESKYLLTSFAECGVCRGTLHVRSRSHGQRRVFFYACSNYHLRGRSVCVNGFNVPMEATDAAVLAAIETTVLTPETLILAIHKAVKRLTPSGEVVEAERTAIHTQLAHLGDQLARLAQAVADGGELPALVRLMRDLERQRTGLHERLAALEGLQQVAALDPKRIEADLYERLADWRGVLRRHVSETRQILRKVIVGRLVFTPREKTGARWYEFTGQGTLGNVV
jgi:DNA invertase Pin-like site-specific DNA recombinase